MRPGGGSVRSGVSYPTMHGEPQQQNRYSADLDASDESSTNTPRTAGGGGSVYNRQFRGSQLRQSAPGERMVRRASNDSSQPSQRSNPTIPSSYAIQSVDGSSKLDDSARYSRSVYDEAQLCSSTRTGGNLYSSGMSTSRRSMASSVSGSGGNPSNHSGMPHSSLRSSNSANDSQSNPNYYPRIHPGSVSLSGNLLVHIKIDEDENLELDKDEIKELASLTKQKEDIAHIESALQMNNTNDTSTIGTTKSIQEQISEMANTMGGSNGNGYTQAKMMVDHNPNNAILMTDDFGKDERTEEKIAKLKRLIFSAPFRRTLFLGICFVLLGLGIVLTMENFMTVKTAEDWIEPKSKKGGWYEGGLDWTFGSDAPRPQAGAHIEYSVENYIADWAHGTSRVPATNTASLDGYGSVALSETVQFKDVPLFWGLPFAGGSIVESVLGQCMNLVQASDGKGITEDELDDLHLSTVFAMGKKYLNVDLSNVEGIERASALALGTSGMADVVYSPLLQEVSDLFSTMNQGRLFIMVRHPVEREFARFRYLRKADHGSMLLKAEDKAMSYDEFAYSDYVADNWMTRTLVRKSQEEELTAQDMHTAKEILRRKALVGIYSDIIGAVRHYVRYFGWDNAMNGGKLNTGTLSCFERAILEGMGKDTYGTDTKLDEAETQEGSVAWRKIMEMNRFDFELYAYSKQLYKFQIALS